METSTLITGAPLSPLSSLGSFITTQEAVSGSYYNNGHIEDGHLTLGGDSVVISGTAAVRVVPRAGTRDVVGTLTCCRLVLVTLGVVSNLFTCQVVRAKVFRGHSYPVYLVAMALLDTVVLLAEGYNAAVISGAVLSIGGDPPEALVYLVGSGIGSCVVMAIGQASRAAAGWLAIALGVDRVVSLASPLRRLSLCTRPVATSVSLGVLAIVFIIYTPVSVLILRSDVKTTPYLSTCQTLRSRLHQATLINTIIADIGPIFVLFLSVVIQVKLVKRRADRLPTVTQHDEMTALRIRKQNNLTKPVLIVLTFRALLMVPITICRLLERYAPGTPMQTTSLKITGYEDFLFNTSLEVCELISILCHFSTFYLLLLASNTFRRCLLLVCGSSFSVSSETNPDTNDATSPDPKQRQSLHQQLDMFIRTERKRKIVSIQLSTSHDPRGDMAFNEPVDITKIRVGRQDSDALSVSTHPRLTRMPTPIPAGSDAPEVHELQEDALRLPVGVVVGFRDKKLPVVLPTEILLREAINRLYSLERLKRSTV